MDSPRPEFHVPGAYHFDNLTSNPSSSSDPSDSSLPGRVLGADVFLPPADLTKSTGSLFSEMSITTTATNPMNFQIIRDAKTGKRKRPEDFSRESTPVAGEYTFAGQIDVDGTQSSQGMEESECYSDVEYRRQLGPSQESYLSHMSHASHNSPKSQSRNAGERWTVLNALGNVVGKVWNFCTTGAFRGFHAGGGDGYDWETGMPAGHQQSAEVSTGFTFGKGAHGIGEADEDSSLKFELSPTGLPPLTMGGFAVDGERAGTGTRYSYDCKESSGTPPPRRQGKRRQLESTGNELNHNWVMVDSKQRVASRTFRPSRSTTSATMVRSHTPDRSSSPYRTSRAAIGTTGTAASSRRINTPISRLGPSTPSASLSMSMSISIPTSAAQGQDRRQQRVSHAGSPGLSTREPASFASPRASPRATTPLGSRRATMAGGFQRGDSPSSSRIPVLSIEQGNPFSHVTSSSRPSSALGQRSSSSTGQHRSSSSISMTSPGHRRSYSAKMGSDFTRETRQRSPKKMGGLESFEESPRLTDEAKRLAAKKIVAERDADAKMEALNYQLQQMIRQGREALGTTFEVDVGDGTSDDGDEGDELWADDV